MRTRPKRIQVTGSDIPHLYQDTREDWDKLEKVSLKPNLQFPLPMEKGGKKKFFFQKDFSMLPNKR